MFRITRVMKKTFTAFVLVTFIMSTLLSSVVFADDLTSQKTVYTVATAHLDTQWNWDVKTTINNYISKTLINNFILFEKYPDYKFNFEGAFKYSLMKEYYPEQYAQLKDYIDQGKWNVVGSSWDAGDVNVPSPEAVMRNTLYGNEFFKEEFGKTSADIFLPDCFGFGYALPSIASHMGLVGFSTQKLTWGSVNGVPFDIGKWYGVDGSYLISALNPGSYSSSITAPVSGDTTWVNRVNSNGDAHGIYGAYKYYGTGDTGGSPSDGSVKLVQQDITNGANPTTGVKVLSATADQLYKDIIDQGLVNQLPEFDNELIAITHGTGSYTSRTMSKRLNRENELLADATERTSVMADWLGGAPYPKEQLDTAWKRFLWHQFHDDLTGTSLPSAYMISWNDYILSLNQFAQEFTNGVGAIANAMDTQADGVPVIVYNPVSKARKDLVEAKINFPAGVPDAIQVYDPNGNEVPSQLGAINGDNATVIFLADVDSVGYKTYDVQPSAAPSTLSTGLSVTDSTLENDTYKVTLNSDGDIASIFDKVNNKELLATPSRLEIFGDTSSTWPSWEIIYNDIKGAPKAYVSGPATVKIVENGPARVALEVTRNTLGSTYVQTIRLGAGDDSQRVDVVNNVNWYTKAANLKASFPLAVSNPKATYDLGLGTIQRGNNTSNSYEVPAQQWAELTDTSGDYGVSIINDSKYGWDKPADNELRLTLIHTPIATYGNNKQDTQDFGENRFTYSIYGHSGDYVDGQTIAQGERLNQPLKAFQTASHSGELGKDVSFLNLDNPNVTVKAVKLAENGNEYIVRVQETSGSPISNVVLSMGNGIASAREVNGAEDLVDPADVQDGNLVFDIGRYKPKTFAITLDAPQTALTAPESNAIELPYNKDVVTFDSNKTDGALDTLGNSIPAELLPATITSGGIQFEMGPTAEGSNNAVASSGQEISIPAGYKQVYLLAASTAGDTTDTFLVDGDPVSLKIADYRENVGTWDLYANGTYGNIKRNAVAWVATHTHNPAVTTPSSPISAPGNSAYDFDYMFRYKIDLPEGASTITLPENSDILVFAMTASNNDNDNTVSASTLYDEKTPPTLYKLTVNKGTGSGAYPEGVVASVSAVVPVGYAFRQWIGPVANPKAINTTVTMGTEPLTVTAELISLGTDLALGKPVTASGYVNSSEAPQFAVDGKTNTKWCQTGSSNKWLRVDLGQDCTINRWIVRHAGDGGESTGWNTRDFRLQKSSDGTTWVDVDSVTYNTANITDRFTNPFTARYVRLYITKATNTSDTAARIYEFELYAAQLNTLNTLTVNNGSGSGLYPEGVDIPITAIVPAGYMFEEWVGPVADPNASSTTVTMGAEPLTVTAVITKLGTNLALNKIATASGQVNDTSEAASKAVDGLGNTKWCHNTLNFPDKWLALDLGQEYTINRWIVKHAGFGGESTSYNTRDFKLQSSSDGNTWVDVDTVLDNTENMTNRFFNTPFTARHVRLVAMTPTNSSDQATRIFELELYAPRLETVSLSADKTELFNGRDTAQLKVNAKTDDGNSFDLATAAGAIIEYTSDNKNVAKVDANGVVTPVDAGTANIAAIATLNGITLSCNAVKFDVVELASAVLSSDNAPIGRNQSPNITISKAFLSNGETVDLSGDNAKIEYISSNSDVLSVENGAPTAKNVGTAELYAIVSLDGIKVETNKITVTVTTSSDSIKRLINEYETSEDLLGPLVPQLTNSLTQAEMFFGEKKLDQAIKHMEDFIKHLNNPPMDSRISDAAKEAFNLDAQALIAEWTVDVDGMTTPQTDMLSPGTTPLDGSTAEPDNTQVDTDTPTETDTQSDSSSPESDAQLESVAISSDNIVLERNQTFNITLSEALLSNGETIDLIDNNATIEYVSSSPDVVAVENGSITAKNVGTAEVYAIVILNGIKVESNRVTVEVTTSGDSIRSLIENYVISGDLFGSLVPQLTDSLTQAQQFIEETKYDQAVTSMDNFVNSLNNPPAESRISEPAKETLTLDANALINVWSKLLGNM